MSLLICINKIRVDDIKKDFRFSFAVWMENSHGWFDHAWLQMDEINISKNEYKHRLQIGYQIKESKLDRNYLYELVVNGVKYSKVFSGREMVAK